MLDISVIIPFYNSDTKMLEECLTSIAKETKISYEIIIVNDGSNKNITTELNYLIENLRSNKIVDNITILYQKNQGVSSARNLGVKNSQGRYIAFIDSDDLLLNHFLDNAYKLAVQNDADFIIGKIYRGKNSIDVLNTGRCKIIKDKVELKRHLISYKQLYHFKDGTYISRGPVARLVKKSLANSTPFNTEIEIGEDAIWNLDIIDGARRILLVNELWYFYRENNESVCNKQDIYAYNKFIKKHLEIQKRIDLTDIGFYKNYVELFLEDLKSIHRRGLYKKTNDVKIEEVAKSIYSKMYFDVIFDSSFRNKLDFISRTQLIAFEQKNLFFLYSIFREVKKYVTEIKERILFWRKY